MPPKIHCLYDALVDPSKLKYHPKNRNKHSKEQIERLAKIIEYQGWRYAIKVSKNSGFVTSGHGRIAAAFLKKWKEVPVVYQDYESDEQEYADVQADNAIASWAELDLAGINVDLADLGPDFDIEFLGLKDFVIEPAEKLSEKEKDELYTKKIESPIYKIEGTKPEIKELFDNTKTDELIKQIDKSKIPSEVKEFLTLAAQRHTIFNYQNIAEFYAHADKETQNLMENSALVIIDFKKAIENGFIKLTKQISEEYL